MTTWLPQGQTEQGQQFMLAIALEYAAKSCCLKEAKSDVDKG